MLPPNVNMEGTRLPGRERSRARGRLRRAVGRRVRKWQNVGLVMGLFVLQPQQQCPLDAEGNVNPQWQGRDIPREAADAACAAVGDAQAALAACADPRGIPFAQDAVAAAQAACDAATAARQEATRLKDAHDDIASDATDLCTGGDIRNACLEAAFEASGKRQGDRVKGHALAAARARQFAGAVDALTDGEGTYQEVGADPALGYWVEDTYLHDLNGDTAYMEAVDVARAACTAAQQAVSPSTLYAQPDDIPQAAQEAATSACLAAGNAEAAAAAVAAALAQFNAVWGPLEAADPAGAHVPGKVRQWDDGNKYQEDWDALPQDVRDEVAAAARAVAEAYAALAQQLEWTGIHAENACSGGYAAQCNSTERRRSAAAADYRAAREEALRQAQLARQAAINAAEACGTDFPDWEPFEEEWPFEDGDRLFEEQPMPTPTPTPGGGGGGGGGGFGEGY